MAQITIGRNAQSTIVVDAQYNTVSGNHATISYDGTTYTLEQVLRSDDVAKVVFEVINNKDHPYFRTVKKNLEIARKTSQMSTDAYIGKSMSDVR